eukprot:1156482-Pelagomonas_calceolata.AAC.1
MADLCAQGVGTGVLQQETKWTVVRDWWWVFGQLLPYQGCSAERFPVGARQKCSLVVNLVKLWLRMFHQRPISQRCRL